MMQRAVLVAGIPMVSWATVHADDGSEKTSTKVKVSQLPIYGEPKGPEFEFIPPKDTYFKQQVTEIRKTVFDFLFATKSTADNINQKYETAKAHTNDLLHFIQEDSGAVSRAGIITVAGLGGVVAGYRGGVMRKALYATIMMAGAGAVCYPHQAVDITSTGWTEVSKQARTLWQDNMGAGSSDKKESKGKEETPVIAEAKSVETDMSKPEDKDMYTTRSA